MIDCFIQSIAASICCKGLHGCMSQKIILGSPAPPRPGQWNQAPKTPSLCCLQQQTESTSECSMFAANLVDILWRVCTLGRTVVTQTTSTIHRRNAHASWRERNHLQRDQTIWMLSSLMHVGEKELSQLPPLNSYTVLSRIGQGAFGEVRTLETVQISCTML